jgi:integrase
VCDSAKCQCGSERFLVDVYWKGKHETFRRSFKGETLSRKEAENILFDINRLFKAGKFDPDKFRKSRRTFGDVIDEYIAEKKEKLDEHAGSPGFFRNLVGYRKNYYSVIDDVPFADVDGEEIHKIWMRVKNATKTVLKDGVAKEAKIKTKTKKNIINTLHSFYTRWIAFQPWADGISIPRFPLIDEIDDSVEMKAIEEDVQYMVLQNLEGVVCNSCRPDQKGKIVGHSAPFEFCAETGIRQSEVCLIKLKNIYIDRRDFYICEHYVRWPGQGWVVWPGLKSSRQKKDPADQKGRWVQMSDRAIQIVIEAMGERNVYDNGEEYLFINPITGREYLPDAIYRAFHQYGGLKNVTFHEATRHTFVTGVMEADITTQSAMIVTGHSDERTLKKYNHVRRSRIQEVMDVVKDRKEKKKAKVIEMRLRPSRNETETSKAGGDSDK